MNLALFDLDKTLIPIDSDHRWGEFLVEQGIVDAAVFKKANDTFYEQYKSGTLNIQEYLAFALKPMALQPKATVDAWHATFMRTCIEPHIHASAFALLNKHRDQGDLCAIVTATNEFVTRPIAHRFEIEHLIAVQCETLPDGRLSGASYGVPSFGAGKIARVNDWLADMGKTMKSFEQTWFYSDSMNDLPLLRAVSHPVATNPDAILKAEAQQNRWPILELFSNYFEPISSSQP